MSSIIKGLSKVREQEKFIGSKKWDWPEDWPKDREEREDDEFQREPVLGTGPTEIGTAPKQAKISYDDSEGMIDGKRYNKILKIKTKDPVAANSALKRWEDVEWGAKEIVKKDTESDPNFTIVYIIDNHKHGYWKPFEDEPGKDPFKFTEEFKKSSAKVDEGDVIKGPWAGSTTTVPSSSSSVSADILKIAALWQQAEKEAYAAQNLNLGSPIETKIQLQSLTNHLSRRGYDIDSDGESLILRNKRDGKKTVLPISDLDKNTGWAKNLFSESLNNINEADSPKLDPEQVARKAFQIVRQIAYDDTVPQILVQIDILADEYLAQNKRREYEQALDSIYQARNHLESEIIKLSELFAKDPYANDDEDEFGNDLYESSTDKKKVYKIKSSGGDVLELNGVSQYPTREAAQAALSTLEDQEQKKYRIIAITVEGYSAGAAGGAGLGEGKKKQTKNEGQIYSTGGGAGQAYRKFRPKKSRRY